MGKGAPRKASEITLQKQLLAARNKNIKASTLHKKDAASVFLVYTIDIIQKYTMKIRGKLEKNPMKQLGIDVRPSAFVWNNYCDPCDL